MKITLTLEIQSKEHNSCPFQNRVSGHANPYAKEGYPEHFTHVIHELVNIQALAIEDAFRCSFQECESALKRKEDAKKELLESLQHLEEEA